MTPATPVALGDRRGAATAVAARCQFSYSSSVLGNQRTVLVVLVVLPAVDDRIHNMVE